MNAVEVLLHGEAGRVYESALVSPADAPLVASFKWWVQINECGPYAYTWEKDATGKIARPRRKLFMHRLIADTPSHLEADHRNRNTLDNRRENLRNIPQKLNGARPRFPDDAEFEAFVEESAARQLAGAVA